MKRAILLLLCVFLLLPGAVWAEAGGADEAESSSIQYVQAAEAAAVPESMGMDWQENDPWPFAILHGDRSVPQIAITMDDCFNAEWVQKTWELVTSYGARMTFYPSGYMLTDQWRQAGDQEMWQKIAASDSEIGTHTHQHVKMTELTVYNIILYTKYPQYVTDLLLGYHYPLRTLRPPYGEYNKETEEQLKALGYNHVILWDIDSTDPQEILSQVKNGSILLFHSNSKDYHTLQTVVPELISRGYELVTVSELLHLPELDASTEIFDWASFKATHLQ